MSLLGNLLTFPHHRLPRIPSDIHTHAVRFLLLALSFYDCTTADCPCEDKKTQGKYVDKAAVETSSELYSHQIERQAEQELASNSEEGPQKDVQHKQDPAQNRTGDPRSLRCCIIP
ncbi:hypothetical protein B0H16DRAFT_1456083 [Mycena metata]|uniref:Uncharacterized protein n=1 Tax=Mycena metata TaxID=1033252 RepID=A0AAD7NIG7_9AGAR|nr:hypothetical protein B0H16DRAFT_1456083 [Mycena metata]